MIFFFFFAFFSAKYVTVFPRSFVISLFHFSLVFLLLCFDREDAEELSDRVEMTIL